MLTPLSVLILEDQPADAELIINELRRAGFDPDWRRVASEAEYLSQLHQDFDVILADYHMPQFDAPRALHLLQEQGLNIPFLLNSKVGMVFGDPNRLQQVFWNLFSNAVKFTPKGGRIQIRLRRGRPCRLCANGNRMSWSAILGYPKRTVTR